MSFNSGSSSNSTWHVPEPEASHANLSCVVDCLTAEIHHSRETGPPEQPQHEVRRPLAQSRPSAVPQNFTRPSQTQFFIPLTGTDQVTTSLRSSIAVPPSLLPAWGFGAASSHPRRPKSDSLFGGAGRSNRPFTAAPRGGRGLSLASLVALGCSLTLTR